MERRIGGNVQVRLWVGRVLAAGLVGDLVERLLGEVKMSVGELDAGGSAGRHVEVEAEEAEQSYCCCVARRRDVGL